MTTHLTSTQQRRANAQFSFERGRMSAFLSHWLDGRGTTTNGGGYTADWGVPAPNVVNETKAAIVAVMHEFDRPVFSRELYGIWDGARRLEIFDYHLCTLVQAGIADIVIGPELSFRLTEAVKVRVEKKGFTKGGHS